MKLMLVSLSLAVLAGIVLGGRMRNLSASVCGGPASR